MRKIKSITLLLLSALLLRVILSNYGTLSIDQNTFIAWAHSLKANGLSGFYSNTWSDYLPGYLFVLRILASIETLEIVKQTTLYKLPAIFGDLGVGWLVYKIIRKKFSENKSLIAASLFLFNPAVIANSTLWGQVDVLTCLFALGAIFFLRKNQILSLTLLSFGVLIKPQAVMVLPVILAIQIAKEWKFKKVFTFWLLSGAVGLLGFAPFYSSGNFISFVLERVSATLGQYPYGSVNAFNFWGLWGFWVSDQTGVIPANIIGSVIVIIISLFVFLKLVKLKNKYYLGLAILFLLNFLFTTRMHERHLLPTLAPLAIAAISSPILLLVYAGLSLTYLANLRYSFLWIAKQDNPFPGEFGVYFMIILNLILFLSLVLVFLKTKKIFQNKLKLEFSKNKLPDLLTKTMARRGLFVILIFSLLTRVINLSYPPSDYFDEIYHAFTARQILKGDPDVWHWTSSAPEGFAYEWTHPPLPKEIMALSMFALGENSFAWRFPGVLMGVGVVFLVYKIALYLFKRRDIALLSALFMSLDGLVLTMSRIGTGDIYFLFFSLLTFYLFLTSKHFWASIALGLTFASKWSTLWFLPVLVMSHFILKRKLKKSLAFYLAIPVLVYVMSYIPMFLSGYGLDTFWGMQKQMWWYHSNLEATHPYTSSWWSWPLMLRPIYLYQFSGNGAVGNIYAMGNPLFFWSGLVSVLISLFLFLRKKLSREMLIVLYAYVALFIPWALSPRIMFVYHYLPSLPFLAIILSVVLRRFTWAILPVVGVSLMLFVYFYPHWTGMHIPLWLDNSYYWLSSWR